MSTASGKKVKQPLKWHGGKYYLSNWLHSLAPPHTHRVYLYAGGLGEMWNWPHEGVSEVANDLNGYLINFYRVLQFELAFKAFKRRMEATPFARDEWKDAAKVMAEAMAKLSPTAVTWASPNVPMAVAFFIWNRQSMAGRMTDFAPPTRSRTRGGRNAEANSWWSAVDGLPEVRARLDGVVVEHTDALKLLRREDKAARQDKKLQTLVYADPTYLMTDVPGEGRTTAGVYQCESDRAHHEALVECLAAGVSVKVMLSGYRSKLYDGLLTPARGWTRHEKKIDNKAQKGSVKRPMTECVWTNYPPPGGS